MTGEGSAVDLPDLLPMDVAGRLPLLRQAMADADITALWVTDLDNVRWLTGFTGSNARVLITPEELVAVTDGRYREQIADQLDTAGVDARVEVTVTDVGEVVTGALAAGTRLGIEADHLTVAGHRQLLGWLDGAAEVVATTGILPGLRRRKDEGEQSRLIRAAAMADVALAAVAPMLGRGPTEKQVAQALDRSMVDLGADAPSYETIVASGPNAALPHARPTDRVIEADDLVIIDVGARLDGYGSDMTRTFVAGGEPSAEQQRWYDAVIKAQAAGVASVAEGVELRAVDRACRSVLEDHGLAEAFIHGTGHGIGLRIHEDPFLSARSDGILQRGFVVTVEPGVYLPGRGGVRIEDAVIVLDEGCETITHSPKTITP
ncbi:MAG: aminopeptidase P family protein [Actinomycetota bacterium]